MTDPIDVYSELRARYPKEAYALMFEVRNATGFEGSRSADALVMGLYPSRGLELEGFEFKAARADWLSELNNPAKAEEISQYCDRWWIVATKPGIVKKADLPPTGGLLSPGKKGLRIQVRAPQLETRKSLNRGFTASIFREVQRQTSNEQWIEKEVDRQVDMRLSQSNLESRLARERTRVEKEQDARVLLEQKIRAFESASGCQMHPWQGEEVFQGIGEIVKIVMDGGVPLADIRRRAEGVAQGLAGAQARIASALEVLGELERSDT